MKIKIRNATLLDIPSILDIVVNGRHTSADEVRTRLQIDSKAIFLAEAFPNGKILGICCGIRHTPVLGFIGLHNVLEEYREKGIGSKLFKAAKEHLGDRNIGINMDPVKLKKHKDFCHIEDYEVLTYKCFGDSIPTYISSSCCIEVATYFEGNLIGCSKKGRNSCNLASKHEPHEGFKNIYNNPDKIDSEITCIEGNIEEKVERDEKYSLTAENYNTGKSFERGYVSESVLSRVNIEDILPELSYNRRIKSNIELIQNRKKFPINLLDMDHLENSKAENILTEVLAFDKLLHKWDRSFLVRQTFCWSSCLSKVALDGGKVIGYACLRKIISENWIIAPFYADNEDIAELLLFELLQGFDFSQAPKGIQILFPDKNIACKKLVEKFGFRLTGLRLSTGFTKWCLNVDTSKVYSLHSPHFGSE